MDKFEYIYAGSPIDFWHNATLASEEESKRVLAQMPDEPRDGLVYKAYIPMDLEYVPLFICKGDNNGDTYFFCDEDFVYYYSHGLVRR